MRSQKLVLYPSQWAIRETELQSLLGSKQLGDIGLDNPISGPKVILLTALMCQ